MTEDEIAEKAWKQYEQDKDTEAFFSNVSSVGYAFGFRLPYYKALVLHKNGRDKEAAGHIALAINHFEGILRNKRCNENCSAKCGNQLYRLGYTINYNIGDHNRTKQYSIKGVQYDPMESDYDDNDFVDLYSFRRYNQYSIQDLINNEITVVSPSEMNDPFDSIYNLYRDLDNLATIFSEENDILGFYDMFNYYRVRSFVKGNSSKNIKNILMWSHYTDGHKGFCIKYRLSKHFINTPTENGHLCLKNIRYTNKPIVARCNSIDNNTAFATKNKHWEYEQEARLISYDVSTESPFFAHSLDDTSSIKTIYFGYRCEMKTKETIYNIVKSKYPTCIFKQMTIDTSNNIYNLIAQPFNYKRE